VIDNLDQTDRLLCKLEESLPLAHYLGDEGGILCRLAFRISGLPAPVLMSLLMLDVLSFRFYQAYEKHLYDLQLIFVPSYSQDFVPAI